MGEIIRKIGKIKIHDKEFEVELNESGGSVEEKIVHIQNQKVRYEITESEFLELCANIIHARDNLKKIKDE